MTRVRDDLDLAVRAEYLPGPLGELCEQAAVVSAVQVQQRLARDPQRVRLRGRIPPGARPRLDQRAVVAQRGRGVLPSQRLQHQLDIITTVVAGGPVRPQARDQPRQRPLGDDWDLLVEHVPTAAELTQTE